MAGAEGFGKLLATVFDWLMMETLFHEPTHRLSDCEATLRDNSKSCVPALPPHGRQ